MQAADKYCIPHAGNSDRAALLGCRRMYWWCDEEGLKHCREVEVPGWVKGRRAAPVLSPAELFRGHLPLC